MRENGMIIIVGSVAIDAVVTPFGKRDFVIGGSAAYSSISASFFNPRTGIVACVGDDFPKRYHDLLRRRRILLDGLEALPGKTFRWKGDYRKDLNNPRTVYTNLNVFRDFKPIIPRSFKNAPYVFLANIDPDIQESVLSQFRGAKLILCDTMNFWIKNKTASVKRLMRKVDFFLMNEGEAREISGEENILKSARYILSRGCKSVIIKRGEYGLMFFSRDFTFSAPAYPLDRICDPTGAGDSFAGGMLGYLSSCGKINEAGIRKSLVYGNIMASFAVQEFGVRGTLRLRKQDVKRRFSEFARVTEF